MTFYDLHVFSMVVNPGLLNVQQFKCVRVNIKAIPS